MAGEITLVAMATWGELGNLLAAKRLARCLETSADAPIRVIKAEDLFPRFAAIGAEIERLAKTRVSPAVTYERYMAYMASLEAFFTPGFEADDLPPVPLATELQPMAAFIRDEKPALLAGTKGIISRALLAASRLAGVSVPLINFVTNEGLLTIPLHRSTALPHHLVPFESGRQYLLREHGYASSQVRTVGRLVAFPGAMDAVMPLAEDGDLPIRIVIFSNRGGAPYLRPLLALAQRAEEIGVVFIGFNDPELTQQARALIDRSPRLHGRVVDSLTQSQYLACIRWLAEGDTSLLITKTGPNTMLEAAYFGVPQLVLNSGLPMEQWVAPFVSEHGFGMGFTEMDPLVGTLTAWLDAPEEIRARRQAARRFSAGLMNQDEAERTIRAEFRRALTSVHEPAR